MTDYMQFATTDGGSILVAVDEEEVAPTQGVMKAGLRDLAEQTIATAQATFEDAMERLVRYNARAIVQAVHSLEQSPDEAEISFGIMVTGQLGNLAIAKVGGQANFTVRLAWKREAKPAQESPQAAEADKGAEWENLPAALTAKGPIKVDGY